MPRDDNPEYLLELAVCTVAPRAATSASLRLRSLHESSLKILVGELPLEEDWAQAVDVEPVDEPLELRLDNLLII
jgi:hypothetical protein